MHFDLHLHQGSMTCMCKAWHLNTGHCVISHMTAMHAVELTMQNSTNIYIYILYIQEDKNAARTWHQILAIYKIGLHYYRIAQYIWETVFHVPAALHALHCKLYCMHS